MGYRDVSMPRAVIPPSPVPHSPTPRPHHSPVPYACVIVQPHTTAAWGAEAKAKEEDLVEWAADWDDDTVETDFDVALKKELAAFREGATATAAATAAVAVNVDTEVK